MNRSVTNGKSFNEAHLFLPRRLWLELTSIGTWQSCVDSAVSLVCESVSVCVFCVMQGGAFDRCC